MNGADTFKERRRSPRLFIRLPLEYRLGDARPTHGGVVINVSEVGLLINSIKNMPVGTRLSIAVLFPKEFELTNFQVLAEVVWKDIHLEEGWEGFRYGLSFVQISEQDHSKLRELLLNQWDRWELS